MDQVNDSLTFSLNQLSLQPPQTGWESALQAGLRDAETHTAIKANDSRLLQPAQEFCRRWRIPEQAATNFAHLTCGQTRFPVILLQNPTNMHDSQTFEEMIEECKTLKWLRGTLQLCELRIQDVIILDICPLISQAWIEARTEDEAEDVSAAMSEAYQLAEQVLDIIQPRIILTCQCATQIKRLDTASPYAINANELARKLCSSRDGAKQKRVDLVSHRDRSIYVAQGFHPMYFFYKRSKSLKEADYWERLLRSRIADFFRPCGVWKHENEPRLHEAKAQLERLKSQCEEGQRSVQLVLNEIKQSRLLHQIATEFAQLSIQFEKCPFALRTSRSEMAVLEAIK